MDTILLESGGIFSIGYMKQYWGLKSLEIEGNFIVKNSDWTDAPIGTSFLGKFSIAPAYHNITIRYGKFTYPSGIIVECFDKNSESPNMAYLPCGIQDRCGMHRINDIKISISETLPNGDVRKGNFDVNTGCVRNGEFRLYHSDSSQTRIIYKNDSIISEKRFTKDMIAEEEKIAVQKQLQSDAEWLKSIRYNKASHEKTLADVEYMKPENVLARFYAAMKKGKEETKRLEDKINGVEEKISVCYSCNGGSSTHSKKCPDCSAGSTSEKTQSAQYISGGIGSVGAVQFTTTTKKYTCKRCYGTGYYFCNECVADRPK